MRAMNKKIPANFEEYTAPFPKKVQKRLRQMRQTVRKAAPQAKETISYRIPTYVLNGNLVHFGAYRSHIGFYPTSSGITAFKKDLSPYQTSRGAARFPMEEPLPLGLVSRIVKYRVKENTVQRIKHGG
jgi:uncharacterized protein YdhG (YjbR/CyaY superfamily)